MLAVAGCISQLKWLYFKHSARSLNDIQIFDDASRGPLGAFELLTRLSPKGIFADRCSGAGWASWAAVLTILALALDPFAQQILSFPLRSVPIQADRLASISTAQIYDTGTVGGVGASHQRHVDVAMQGAVMNGLYTLGSPLDFTCTTANCTWPTFYTVGICSSCTNVTEQTKTTCSPPIRGGMSCNYTLPSGLKLSSSRTTSSGGGSVTTLNMTGSSASGFSDRLVNASLVRISNGAGTYEIPEAFDCRLSWCAKRYTNVVVSNGKIDTPEPRSWSLEPPDRHYDKDATWLHAYNVPASAQDFDGPNRTFTVNTNDHKLLGGWLASTFFKAQGQDAVARVLYLEPNVSLAFTNIATSMTNKIREGRNATLVAGTAYREETYIHVNWAWLVLPGVVVLMGVVLLAASIWLCRGEEDGLWKNSIIATMVMQVRGWKGLGTGRWSEMGGMARGMKGRVEGNEVGGFDFVRAWK
ncbi:hypothetical protein CC86DRAFT_463392 [Ophiobolus disseminans]|uniref:Uncharacterized protein n=1 Tax=Ophiobolus disseminans TaxID=1469910 RepID=A0A6A7AFR1_9PLEO|nr:hypothetical protein CC86DRAFT_463392 [Ophiobolus disseminans]